jgi:hypothetical protein
MDSVDVNLLIKSSEYASIETIAAPPQLRSFRE